MKDIQRCHPRLQKLADELLIACERKGIPIKITQGYRSKAEQDALYAKGRTKPGNVVTKARGGYSMHNWGVAFDICRADGKDPYDDSDGYFLKVGKVGKSLGLEWGGDWKFKDKPHFQLPDWGSTTEKLRTRYGTYEKFVKTWDADKPVATKTTTPVKKVEARMKTIKKGSKGKAVKVWQIIVGVVPDGKFGSGTEANTLTFQKKHKLTPDGKVGEKTWKAGLESL